MLILRSSLTSPFGRKVRMAAHVAGVHERLKIETADPANPDDSLRLQNPLGKIPTLVLEDGVTLFDSSVIVEYLNEISITPVLIPPGAGRIAVLRQQALADGLMDAAALQVYEARFRTPEQCSASWLAYQKDKVERALCFAAQNYALPRDGLPHIGEITLATALAFLDRRFAGAWRNSQPALVEWLGHFAVKTPAFALTEPPTPP